MIDMLYARETIGAEEKVCEERKTQQVHWIDRSAGADPEIFQRGGD